MKYEELVDNVRMATKQLIASKTLGTVAYQFNVEGEAEGAFYLEISDGKINVEPYEYFDRDLIIVTSADIIMQMLEGKLQPMTAYLNGQMKVYGDAEFLKVLPLGSRCCTKGEKTKSEIA